MTRCLTVPFLGLALLGAAFAQSDLKVSALYGGAVQTLPPGGGLSVTATNVGQAVLVSFTVQYTGSSAAIIQNITLTGTSEMGITSGPSLPAALAPGASLAFTVTYSPATGNAASGQVAISYSENSQALTYQVLVNGSSPNFGVSYFFAPAGSSTNLGSSIAFPATNLGSSATVTITVLNSGGLAGTLQSVTSTGAAYQLANAPSSAAQISPGQQVSFSVSFAPAATGGNQGVLTLNLNGIIITVVLSGTGIAPSLSASYTLSNGNVQPLSNGSSIAFPSVTVGSTTTAAIAIQNQGTGPGTVTGIAVTGTGFQLTGSPLLPATLPAGQTLVVDIVFAPPNAGSFTGTYAISLPGQSIAGTLAGSTNPPALPSYQFTGPSGVQQPDQQPSVGLSLSSPYSLPLEGALTLTFASSVFADDPAIQFASGGRTVAFTIPANSTQALFNGIATSIALQTGTTAGAIVITPAFALQNGFIVTPATPAALTMTIAAAAPQLLSGSITSETLDSFSLVLNGYVTAHSLQQLSVQVTPKSGESFSTTSLAVDLATSAAAWFGSASSSSFGGAFQITVPFVLSNGSTTDDLVHALQSLSITATNGIGSSTALSVAIP